MRILQVGTGFASIPPRGTFAAQRVIHFQSAALVALGHDVTVLDIADRDRPGVPYHVEEVTIPVKWKTTAVGHAARGFQFAYGCRRRLLQMLGSQRFDIANFHNQFSARAIPLVKRHDVPAVYTVHNPLWLSVEACQSAYQRLRFRQDIDAMRQADVVVCLNRAMVSNIVRHLGIPEAKFAVVPNGVPDEWFDEIAVPERLLSEYAPNGQHVVINVARIAPYKNQLTLAKTVPLVAREVPNTRFVFVGPTADSAYRRKIMDQLVHAKAMPWVSFAGEVPHSDLRQLYSLGTLAVFPSQYEGMPLAALEAMAQGRPVVSSDIDPFRELLDRDTGRLVATFDHEVLAATIVELLRDEELRRNMGRKAQEHVRANYTWESVAERTAGIYERLVHGR